MGIVLTGVGFTIDELTPDPADSTKPISITYGMWAGAVRDQVVINGSPGPIHSTSRLLGFSASEVQDASSELDENVPQNDVYWHSGNLEVKCLIAHAYEQTYYQGDVYDIHGFQQRTLVPVKVQKQIYPVFIFRRVGSTLEPTPAPDEIP